MARGSGRSAGWAPAGSAGCGSPSDNQLGHVVALKAAHAPDAETEKRLEREARALAAVRHPNCVRIYDLVPARSDPGLSDMDGMVIVMGYVDGQSLGDLVRDHGVLDEHRRRPGVGQPGGRARRRALPRR